MLYEDEIWTMLDFDLSKENQCELVKLANLKDDKNRHCDLWTRTTFEIGNMFAVELLRQHIERVVSHLGR